MMDVKISKDKNTSADGFHFLIIEGGLLAILIVRMIFLSPFLDVTGMSMSTVFFLPQLYSGIFYP